MTPMFWLWLGGMAGALALVVVAAVMLAAWRREPHPLDVQPLARLRRTRIEVTVCDAGQPRQFFVPAFINRRLKR